MNARLFAALAMFAVLLAGCGGSDDAPAAAPSGEPSAPAELSPPPPPPPPPPNPLTGVVPKPSGPLVAVKVDNGVLARPFHRGLERVTVMYEELAEGGATRFLAIYDNTVDTEIGPIRSVRENDLELLAPYGRVAFAFSGGQPGVLARVAAARDAGAVVDVSYNVRPELYRLAERRRDARNFFGVPARMAATAAAVAPGEFPVKEIGFTFGGVPAEVGVPLPSGRVPFSKMSTVGVRWDPATSRWAISQEGKQMPAVAPVNVIVQQVQVRPSAFKDSVGNNTPFTVSIGSGPATVLRDGKRIDGTWSRPDAASGTRFLDPAGVDIPLNPGGATWVLLQPVGLGGLLP